MPSIAAAFPPLATLTGRVLMSAGLIGLGAPVFGIAHFIYADFTASMVPAWIPPNQLFWAYVTGWGHVLGGVSLLTGVAARLGAGLHALMLTSFALALHLPRVLATPELRVEWTMLAIALMLSGAAWSCAGSVGEWDGGRRRGTSGQAA